MANTLNLLFSDNNPFTELSNCFKECKKWTAPSSIINYSVNQDLTKFSFESEDVDSHHAHEAWFDAAMTGYVFGKFMERLGLGYVVGLKSNIDISTQRPLPTAEDGVKLEVPIPVAFDELIRNKLPLAGVRVPFDLNDHTGGDLYSGLKPKPSTTQDQSESTNSSTTIPSPNWSKLFHVIYHPPMFTPRTQQQEDENLKTSTTLRRDTLKKAIDDYFGESIPYPPYSYQVETVFAMKDKEESLRLQKLVEKFGGRYVVLHKESGGIFEVRTSDTRTKQTGEMVKARSEQVLFGEELLNTPRKVTK